MSKFSLSLSRFLKERFKSVISGRETVSAFLVYLLTHLKNLEYDYETIQIMKRVLGKNSNAIDIGCHKGDILKKMIKYAPKGHHFAFEPIPKLYRKLHNKFGRRCSISPLALGNKKGEVCFNYVLTNPGYSGLKRRTYDYPDEKDISIKVQIDLLDHVVPKDLHVDFIKIDVEGAELQVLEGAKAILKRDKPFVVFEHGLGGADHYKTKPEQVFDLLTGCGLKISLLEYFLARKDPLDRHEFLGQFYKRYNYYFIAHP